MENTKKVHYKYCIVPLCKNTTVSTPDKLFFNVPRVAELRKKWCKIMKRDDKKNIKLSDTTPLFCCEDHFDLEKDTENYFEYQIMGKQEGKNINLRLKKGVFPHVFECQTKVVRVPERQGVIKRRRLELLKDVLSTTKTDNAISFEPMEVDVNEPGPSTSAVPNLAENFEEIIRTQDKAVQVKYKPTFRSKGINTKAMGIHIATSPLLSPSVNASTSPFKVCDLTKIRRNLFETKECESDSVSHRSISSQSSTSSIDYEPQSSSSETNWSDEKESEENFKKLMRSGMLTAIEREPKLLLGLPSKTYFLIKLLSETIPAPTVNILITLKKIRLNDAFSVLALHFGCSQSSVSRIFQKTISVMSNKLKELIVWPDSSNILLRLPIPFRARYSKVVSIIDCFEIEIEKPMDPIKQSLTWSQYKACNTLKYLISCTPDGLVNFISDGYGGRASDYVIVEDCGYLNKLPPDKAVMADRGFKNISHILQERNCVLIRPPSVSRSAASSKEEVRQSKRIAALRIHVERVISRIREFNMLLPHACVDNHFIGIMDYIVTAACGLINMQDFLIKS